MNIKFMHLLTLNDKALTCNSIKHKLHPVVINTMKAIPLGMKISNKI
jgi:hypothetical protein